MGKSLSPFMYPMEYRWIRELMPVMNSTMVIDRGSTYRAACTWSRSTGIHDHRSWPYERTGAFTCRRERYTPTDTANEATTAMVPTQPAAGSPRRRPAASRIPKPTRGSRMIR